MLHPQLLSANCVQWGFFLWIFQQKDWIGHNQTAIQFILPSTFMNNIDIWRNRDSNTKPFDVCMFARNTHTGNTNSKCILGLGFCYAHISLSYFVLLLTRLRKFSHTILFMNIVECDEHPDSVSTSDKYIAYTLIHVCQKRFTWCGK